MRILVERIRNAVKEQNGHVWMSDGRIYVSDSTDIDETIRRVTKVFGVHSVCRSIELPKDDFNAICEAAMSLMGNCKGTFKVNARRSDKRYFMNSPEINLKLGGYVLHNNPDLKVDIHNPDTVLSV